LGVKAQRDVCRAVITQPAPLGMSFAMDGLGLAPAGWALGVLNFNFK
jgi:hypothetical protein